MTTNRKSTVAASTQRFCVGSIAAHIDSFAEFLAGEGYAPQTVGAKCSLVADLSHWLKQRGLPLAKLDEARLNQFHGHHRGSRRRGDVFTGHQLLEHLRCLGVVPALLQKSRPDGSGESHTRLREILKFGAWLGTRDIDQLSAHRAKISDRAFREQDTTLSGSEAPGPASVHS
jgi:hypothetical protein